MLVLVLVVSPLQSTLSEVGVWIGDGVGSMAAAAHFVGVWVRLVRIGGCCSLDVSEVVASENREYLFIFCSLLCRNCRWELFFSFFLFFFFFICILLAFLCLVLKVMPVIIRSSFLLPQLGYKLIVCVLDLCHFALFVTIGISGTASFYSAHGK